MSKLKPCPFCGSKAVLLVNQGVYHVECSNCPAMSAIDYSREWAETVWNRRAKDKDLLDLAISLVQDELVTVGKGADIAGLPYYEFEDELKKRGIRWKG